MGKTRGQAAIEEATTARPRISIKDLADRMGVSRETIRRWRMGLAEPTAAQMLELERLGICPMRAWAEPSDDEG